MTNSIDASLYGLTKRNNGNFKSEKQRAFLTSKFGQFCAKDEYLVLGSGMGVAKNTTWVDIFKLSADGSKIESIYRSYTSSKGAKDRFTWVAMPDDEYIIKKEADAIERERFKKEQDALYLENRKEAFERTKTEVKLALDEKRAMIKYFKAKAVEAKGNKELNDKLINDYIVVSGVVQKKIAEKWACYRGLQQDIKERSKK